MAQKTTKPRPVDLKGWTLHNGEGRPDLQFEDPIAHDRIGGQVAAMRQCMRVRNCVNPWARRQGKSTMRQGLIINEASITSGTYYFGLVLPDHATAFKIFESFRKALGAFVKDSKGDDKSQDRWIDLHAIVPPSDVPPAWFTAHMKEKWRACRNGKPNTGSRLYFWSGKHPHYEGIQGFLHPFHRVDVDEAQQVHPLAYAIVRPMLNDVAGSMCITGTPWYLGIGNVAFEDFFETASDPLIPDWFAMRIPQGVNPHVKPVSMAEARLTLSESQIQQLLYAKFLSDAGAVFTNLDRVFVVKPLAEGDPSLDWARAIRSVYALASMRWWIAEAGPVEGHVYGASIDWARSPKGDYSALTVFDFSTGRQVALIRWRGEDFTKQMEVVLAVQKHYGASQLHSDANGMGETMSDFLRRRHAIGFVGHKFGRNKVDYVRRGQVLFADASVSLIQCDEQRKEFKDFSAFEAEGIGSEKQVKYCAPPGKDKHDDLVAAFLQLAPTLTICGRQTTAPPEPPAPPMVDEQGMTSLALWGDGRVPFSREEGLEAEKEWRSVVVPKR